VWSAKCPGSAGHRDFLAVPTKLTPFLRLALPTYFDVLWIVGVIIGIPAAFEASSEGKALAVLAVIVTLVVSGLVVGVLTYGAFRSWRWGYWAYTGLLLYSVVVNAHSLLVSPQYLIGAAVPGVGGFVLLCVAVLALIRFGPWAMKRT
jgi:hypothetical protein